MHIKLFISLNIFLPQHNSSLRTMKKINQNMKLDKTRIIAFIHYHTTNDGSIYIAHSCGVVATGSRSITEVKQRWAWLVLEG